MDSSGPQKLKRIQIHPCIVKGCKGKDSDDISLYKIPENDKEAWCLNLQIKPFQIKANTRVCSRHFEKKWQGTAKLKAGARPTLQLGRAKVKAFSYDASKPRINPRKCCIIGCNQTSPSHRLFKFPADPERYQEWLSICPIKTSQMQNKYKYICIDHFKPSDVTDFRLSKDAKPLASLCFSMQDDIPVERVKNSVKPQKMQLEEEFDYDDDDVSEPFSLDGLECRCCDSCVDYFSKYQEIEQQREEAEARHLIETLALQNQIEELTAELELARNRRRVD